MSERFHVCVCVGLQRMYLVTELCEGGDLKHLLQKHKSFTEEETRHIIKSLSEAIVYLHKKGEAYKTQHTLFVEISHESSTYLM